MIKVLYAGDEVMLVTTYIKGMAAWTDGIIRTGDVSPGGERHFQGNPCYR